MSFFSGCHPFVDTTTPAGIPNLATFGAKMYRMGQPPNDSAWRELANGEQVVVVKLDDETEGNDDSANRLFNWDVERFSIPPEDDKPWTVLLKPDAATVTKIVNTIIDAHEAGHVVVWHCVHGRDRTGLVSALVGMKLYGWPKDFAWQDMLNHGFRWELPDLAAFWLENVQ